MAYAFDGTDLTIQLKTKVTSSVAADDITFATSTAGTDIGIRFFSGAALASSTSIAQSGLFASTSANYKFSYGTPNTPAIVSTGFHTLMTTPITVKYLTTKTATYTAAATISEITGVGLIVECPNYVAATAKTHGCAVAFSTTTSSVTSLTTAYYITQTATATSNTIEKCTAAYSSSVITGFSSCTTVSTKTIVAGSSTTQYQFLDSTIASYGVVTTGSNTAISYIGGQFSAKTSQTSSTQTVSTLATATLNSLASSAYQLFLSISLIFVCMIMMM